MANFPNRCQHLKVNGTQCGSPALRRNRFCYFHKLHHEERIELNADRARRRRNVTLDLPVLKDANSIQVSLMQIMRLIVAGQIDGKTAGLLLYALQTASANLPRVRFEPYMHDVVLDLKTVHETPLGANIWEDSDFTSDEEDEEVMRAQALEEAQRKAKKKAELDRWAEAEANRLSEIGARQCQAEREADRLEARLEADRQREEEERAEMIAPQDARPAAAVTPAGRAVLPPSPSQAKRPPATASMDDVRNQISAQIRKALPAIAAAQASKEKSRRENGNSTG